MTSSPRKIVDTVLLVIVALLFLGSVMQSGRDLIGRIMDLLMSPIVALVGDSNFFLLLSAMAIITAIYTSLIQKYLVDQSKMMATQEKMKIWQNEMKEARKTQNTFMLKKLEEQQAEMMQEQMGMMKQQFKPMLYILVITIPFFMWGYYYIGGHPEASIVFPFWGPQLLSDRVFFMFTYWIFWYILSSLAFSQVLRKFMNIRAPGM